MHFKSDGIKRGSPPSRLENQPARTGRNWRRNKMEKIKRRKLIGINERRVAAGYREVAINGIEKA